LGTLGALRRLGLDLFHGANFRMLYQVVGRGGGGPAPVAGQVPRKYTTETGGAYLR
jgi:hypothetical protein